MATAAELEAIESRIVEDVEAGMTSVAVDGMTVNVADAMQRIKALNELQSRRVANPFATLQHRRLVSRGGD
jgi:hypothetical protein